MSPDGNSRAARGGPPSSLLRWGIAGSAAAALSWIVPDLISSDPVFPLSGLATAEDLRVAGLAAAPVCGALSMLVLMIRPLRRAIPWSCALLGLAGLWASALLRDPALPVSGAVAAGITSAFSLSALAVAIYRPRASLAIHGTALAPALAAASFTIFAVATGQQSFAFAAPYREALALWALSWMVVSGGGLWFGGRR